jgi:hypothetical protein
MGTILTLIIGAIGTVVGVVVAKITENYLDRKKKSKLL